MCTATNPFSDGPPYKQVAALKRSLCSAVYNRLAIAIAIVI